MRPGKRQAHLTRVWGQVRVLVIEEISMVAAALYNKKPLAARAFYGRLAELAPAEDVARFVVRPLRPFHAVFI